VERLHVVIEGDVQGVGFRYYVVDVARSLGVRGWVRNRADGSVELTAEGDRGPLDGLLDAARRGPGGARVHRVQVEWEKARGDLGPFQLIY
jgi:acylphosphatase